MSDPEPRSPGPKEPIRGDDTPDLGDTVAAASPSNRRDPRDVTRAATDDPALTGASATVASDVKTGEHRPTVPTGAGAETAGEPRRALPVIDGYEILGELGRGGMGVVYQARHVRLHRLCAIKMVLAGSHASSEALVRFLAEAEAVAKLRHPHIVAIHHISEYDGLPFIELEYLAGGSLAERLDGTPQPPRPAAELIATLAGAVQAAHEAGVVHRDLKPANVLLDDDGTAKVADFGVAKALGSATGLTATDSILGSPSYMAPEQAGGQSRAVGPAADVYALGAILYELLTGRPPFRAPTVLETLEQVKNTEPVSPSRLVPGLPRDLETIALKCLQKDPAKRYASAAALAEDLRRFLAGEPIVARPGPAWERVIKWCRRRPAVAAFAVIVPLLLVALLGLGVWSYVKINQSLTIAQAERTNAQDSATAEAKARADADDRAEELRRSDYINRVNLALREYLANNVARALELLEGCPADLRGWEWEYVWGQCHLDLATFPEPGPAVNAVAFSPDGRLVACGSGVFHNIDEPGATGTLVVRDAATGEVIFERSDLPGGVRSVAFSPDGRFIAAGFGPHLGVWELATERERFPRRTEPGELSVLALAFSPDGREITAGFGRFNDRSVAGYARLLDAATVETRGEPLPGHEMGVLGVAFSPDGREVALTSRGLVEVWDIATRERRTLRSPTAGAVYAVAFSPDGRFIASAGTGTTIQLWDRATGEPVRPFYGHDSFVRAVAFSPDSRRLVSGGEDNVVKLWEVDAGRELATFRGHTHFVHGVAFSPDGYRVASGGMDGMVKLWFATPSLQLSYDRHDNWVFVAFSPNGRHIASTSWYRNDEPRWPVLWDAATGQPIRSFPSTTNTGPLAFSPDGRRLAAGGLQPGSTAGLVSVWDTANGRLLTFEAHDGGVWGVAFSPDGRRLATGGFSDGTAKIWDAERGRLLRPLLEGDRGRVGVAFSSDAEGRYLATSNYDSTVVRVWDTRTGRLAYPPLKHEFPIISVAFHPGGRLLATGGGIRLGGGSEVTIWDLATGRKVKNLRGHSDIVAAVAFSPDGRRLATGGGGDRTIKLWDTQTFEEVFTLRGHASGVISLAFSPDGRRLVSGSIDGTAKVWDLDLSSLDTLYRREAVALVRTLFDRLLDKQAVLEAIRSDPSLREPMLGVALDVAQGWRISEEGLPAGTRPGSRPSDETQEANSDREPR